MLSHYVKILLSTIIIRGSLKVEGERRLWNISTLKETQCQSLGAVISPFLISPYF